MGRENVASISFVNTVQILLWKPSTRYRLLLTGFYDDKRTGTYTLAHYRNSFCAEKLMKLWIFLANSNNFIHLRAMIPVHC